MNPSYFNRLKHHLIAWLGVCAPLLISGPLAMFSSNFGDFDLGAKQFGFLILPYLSIPFIAPLFTAACPFQNAIKVVLAWLAVALYVQGNIAVWDYGRFDGTDIPWDSFAHRGYADLAIWLGILSIVFVTRQWVVKELPIAIGGLCLLQLGSAVLAFSSSKAPYEVPVPNSSDNSLYSFSKERGILVIILDEFSSQGFYWTASSNPEIKRDFADFTFYRNIISAFPTTYAAVPALLTGQPAPLNGSLSAYFEQTAPDAINEQLAQSGWSSESVTFHPICKQFKFSKCRSLNRAISSDADAASRKELYKLLDLTLFRYSPHFFKKKVYNDEQWFFQNDGKGVLKPGHRSSIRFVDSFEKKITNDSAHPTFKLLHLLIPHGPYNLTPDCNRYIGPSRSVTRKFSENGLCALKVARKIIDGLREAGVYDSTTIIITADHGTPIGFKFKEFPSPIKQSLRRSLPLLLVKPAGYKAADNDEMKVDNRPLSQLDLLGFISELEKLNLRVPASQARTSAGDRIFQNYHWVNDNWSSDTLPPIKRWVVKGDPWDGNSWQLLEP